MMMGLQLSAMAMEHLEIKPILVLSAMLIAGANYINKYCGVSDEVILMLFLLEAMMFGV